MIKLLDKNHRYRNKGLKKQPHGVLKKYLNTPFDDQRQSFDECEFLALDFETTGLNSNQDHIISIGFVNLSKGKVQLKSAQHHIVKTTKKLDGSSVGIHQLTDDAVKDGIGIRKMMELLLENSIGKTIVAHYQQIEYQFIQQASKKLFNHPLPIQIIDTLMIEKKYLQNSGQNINPNQLRLFNLRQKYNLPRYKAHNAMEDAIATAELLLAQIHHRQSSTGKLQLKDLLN